MALPVLTFGRGCRRAEGKSDSMFTLARASAELPLASTARTTLNKELLDAFEHSVLTQSGAK